MIKMTRLFLAATLALSLASPSLADGKKGRPAFVPKPVPPLHMTAPQPPAPPPPVEIKGPEAISLPADFGTGGVGFDVDGGFLGGSRSSATAAASASSMSVALSYTIVSQRPHGHGHTPPPPGDDNCGC
jgi:hypothetical protein